MAFLPDLEGGRFESMNIVISLLIFIASNGIVLLTVGRFESQELLPFALALLMAAGSGFSIWSAAGRPGFQAESIRTMKLWSLCRTILQIEICCLVTIAFLVPAFITIADIDLHYDLAVLCGMLGIAMTIAENLLRPDQKTRSVQ